MIDVKMIFAIGISVVLGVAGIKGMKTLEATAKAQSNVTEGILNYQSSYQALAESMKRWDSNYRSAVEINDLASIANILSLSQYGLNHVADKIMLSSVDPVTQNGASLGMTKICLSNSGNTDFNVTAPDFSTLFGGVKKLANRPDVTIGSFVISGEKEPMAKLNNFCLLIRN